LCGEIFNNGITSEENASVILVALIVNTKMPERFIGIQPSLIELHSNCKKGYGVADLVGYIIESAPAERNVTDGEKT